MVNVFASIDDQNNYFAFQPNIKFPASLEAKL
jgi:hypothetical protein